MIPILYKSTETNFTRNGIGCLIDCLSCTVTEERNGIFECEFKYPITGQFYKEISPDRIIKVKANETSQPQLFRIYRQSKPINGLVKFYAQHISYDLNMNMVIPFTQEKTNATVALNAILEHCFYAHNFTAVSSSATQSKFEITTPVSARKCLGGMDGSILDNFGGEFEFDNFMIRHYSSRGQDNGVVIQYGKNLTDVTADTNISSTYTSIYPYALDEDEDYYELPEKVIALPSQSNFGEPRTLEINLSDKFDSDTRITEELLRKYANEYITSNKIDEIKQNIEVSFIQLWQSKEYETISLLERVKLGDIVTVKYPALGVSVKAKVIKTIYNSLNESYEKIEIGETKSNFADTFNKVNSDLKTMSEFIRTQPSMMERAIAHATDMITGGLGGYVVMPADENGYPEEILIMDTSDKEIAVNVWRFNKGGLGHSHSGYNGPFDDVALTADGQINANMITTGILNADLIRAGTIQDTANKNYWNLLTGEFKLSGDVTDGILDDLSQEQVFNILTNDGAEQGIYMQNGKLYLNATYMTTGNINADLIKSGSLNANLIKVGTIQDVNSNMSINMLTGKINMNVNNGKSLAIWTQGITMYSQTDEVLTSMYVSTGGLGILTANRMLIGKRDNEKVIISADNSNGYVRANSLYTDTISSNSNNNIAIANNTEITGILSSDYAVHSKRFALIKSDDTHTNILTLSNDKSLLSCDTANIDDLKVKKLSVYNSLNDTFNEFERKTVYIQNAATGNMELMQILVMKE